MRKNALFLFIRIFIFTVICTGIAFLFPTKQYASFICVNQPPQTKSPWCNPGSKVPCTDKFHNGQCTQDEICVNSSSGKTPCVSKANATATAVPSLSITASVKNPCPNNSCDTVFGTINVKTGADFVSAMFRVLLGLSGGIALLLIIYSGFVITMSQGNPEKVKGGQETLTSAIVGLLFVILSIAILQIIGVDVLWLPGFTAK